MVQSKSYNFDDHDDSDDEDDNDLPMTLSGGRSVMSHVARGPAWVTGDQSEGIIDQSEAAWGHSKESRP